MNKIEHKKEFIQINISLATISDTRNRKNDKSGDILEKKILDFGHKIFKRTIIKDDREKMYMG